MIVFLVSSAFADPKYVACSVRDFPKEVAKVWHLADHGPFAVDGVVRVATDVPSLIPEVTAIYEIMKFEKHLSMGAWYQLPGGPSHAGPMLALNVLMKRDGTIINAVDAESCEGKRGLALDFFAQLPGTLTEPTPPRPAD